MVWAECLFADPVADIAVLRSPDHQALSDKAAAYEGLMGIITPFAVVGAPKQGIERKKVSYPVRGGSRHTTIKISTPGQGAALVLSIDCKWTECSIYFGVDHGSRSER